MADTTLIYVGAEAGNLYRKEAGQTHWDDLVANGLPPSPEARAIAVHPQNPEIVFIGTQRGLYRSQDRGDHWARMDMPDGRIVWSIRFHPGDPSIVYLGTEGCEVYRSEDGGESFQYQGSIDISDAYQMSFATRILGLAIETANPQHMYAAMEVGGAARSHDGGKSWEVVNGQFGGDVDLLDMHGVAVASAQSDAVFVSNRVGVWRSRERGENWENLRFERFSSIKYSRGVQVAPDDPNTLYACVGKDFGSAEGGIMRSTDLGDTWERFDHGVKSRSTTFGIGVNSQRPEQVYFCARKGQVFGTHDGGSSWKEHPLPEGARDVISVAVASA